MSNPKTSGTSKKGTNHNSANSTSSNHTQSAKSSPVAASSSSSASFSSSVSASLPSSPSTNKPPASTQSVSTSTQAPSTANSHSAESAPTPTSVQTLFASAASGLDSKVPVLSFQCASGTLVRVTTYSGEEIEGIVFTVDLQLRMLALESNTRKSKSYHVIPIDSIKSFLNVRAPTGPFPHPALDAAAIQKREEKTLADRAAEAAKIGKNVSLEAQSIFDALDKTTPCEWREDSILVMGSVIIKPPYSVNDCSGENELQLSRVKRILDEFRKRMKL